MGTAGAEFHHSLKIPPGSTIISKGSDPGLEAYSGFQGTDLAEQLNRRHVKELFLGGLATDYCVKQSSFDAIRCGFTVNVMKDCVRGVNLRRNDSALALHAMAEKGVRLVASTEAIKSSQRAAVKSS
jgi:nicotinamidase/pyrazinamidase